MQAMQAVVQSPQAGGPAREQDGGEGSSTTPGPESPATGQK